MTETVNTKTAVSVLEEERCALQDWNRPHETQVSAFEKGLCALHDLTVNTKLLVSVERGVERIAGLDRPHETSGKRRGRPNALDGVAVGVDGRKVLHLPVNGVEGGIGVLRGPPVLQNLAKIDLSFLFLRSCLDDGS